MKHETLSKIFLCHRIPKRTFKLGKWYFPVCSRCTGIYSGAFLYFAFVYFIYVNYSIEIMPIAIILVIPTFLDGITQFFGFRESNNLLRFITGIFAGVGLVILVNTLRWLLIIKVI